MWSGLERSPRTRRSSWSLLIRPPLSDDTLYDSESYIVNNHTARIMNVSYGACELGNGTAGNVEYYNLWQTAAAEGIAVFVAAGDAGSASCDDGGDAQFGVP